MSYLSSVWANDEDLLIRAPGDFAILVPDGQDMAAGSDGVFSPSDRWTLTSAAVDFEAAGVTSGHVCQLLSPSSAFGPEGEAMAVEAASGHSLTLRRRGLLAGVGQPPGPAAGAGSVRFKVATARQQLEEASWDVNERFGVDEAVPELAPDMLYRARELRQATVLTALAALYMGGSREPKDDFSAKAMAATTELGSLLGRLVVRWNRTTGPQVTGRFSTRIER